jgi:hypothetical protein
VVRASKPFDAEVYQASYSRPLPNIRIPLRVNDPDAILRLQPLIDQAYANGQYGDIDYRQDAPPPLADEERQWIDRMLRDAGKR